MNRRSFLHRIGAGAVAALVLARVPASAINSIGLHSLSRDRIREQMRQIYNDAVNGGAHPREIQLGREAYDTYERDLLQNERFISYETDKNGDECLVFRAAIVRPVGSGWGMRLVA